METMISEMKRSVDMISFRWFPFLSSRRKKIIVDFAVAAVAVAVDADVYMITYLLISKPHDITICADSPATADLSE